MIRTAISAAGTTEAFSLRQVFIALLAMTALLIGLVAMHSAGMVHTESHAQSTELQSVSHHIGGSADIGATAFASDTATHSQHEIAAAIPLLNCGENCAVECALMALSCMMLFVLSALLFLGTFPSILHQRANASHQLTLAIPRATTHIYSPSLTELSIIRT